MANEQRGEIDITLDGKIYILRPTFDAIARVESRLKCGIYDLARRFWKADIGMAESAVLIEECIRETGMEPPKDIGKLIFKTGFSKIGPSMIHLISNAMRGDEEIESEAPAGEA